MIASESLKPLWATIGSAFGSTLWLLAMLFLFIGGIMLFRSGRHRAAKGLRLAGIALLGFAALSVFGAFLHQILRIPALAMELSATAHYAIGVVFSVVGGFVDLALLGLFLVGAVKAAKGIRALADEPARPAASSSVAKPMGTAASAAPVVDRPVAARPAPKAAAAPVPEISSAKIRIHPVSERPVVNVKPSLDDLIPKGPFAKPTSVRTLVEAPLATKSMVSLAVKDGDSLDDTRETALASLPFIADDDDEDELRREPTLLEFPLLRREDRPN